MKDWCLYRKLKRHLKGRKGMALIEVMLAVSLTVIMSLMLMRSHVMAQYSIHTSRLFMEATDVAKTMMEQVKADTYANAVTQTINNVTISTNGTATAADDIEGTVQIDVTTNIDDTKDVVLTVSWSQNTMAGSQNHSVVLTTLLTDLS